MAVVSMSDREFSRIDVLLDLRAGRISAEDAGAMMGLRRRQVFRLLAGFRKKRRQEPGFKAPRKAEQSSAGSPRSRHGDRQGALF
jgi:hypothetical protein